MIKSINLSFPKYIAKVITSRETKPIPFLGMGKETY
jgi:hypothetical protein